MGFNMLDDSLRLYMVFSNKKNMYYYFRIKISMIKRDY